MSNQQISGTIRNMLDLKLTVGQVITGAFTAIVSIVTIVIYVHTTFETKAESAIAAAKFERRIEKTEEAISALTKLQSEIAQNVSYIKGRLEPALGGK